MADKRASDIGTGGDKWRNVRRSNTRALRKLIRSKRIVVDIHKGEIKWPNGSPVFIKENECGYLRFKVHDKKGNCRWFFVHKAIYLAAGKPYRHDRVLDHIDDNNQQNSIYNLQQLTHKENLDKMRLKKKKTNGNCIVN